MSSPTPSPTDTNNFDDADQLDQFTSDMRASDTKKVSDADTASQTIDTFAENTDAGAWPSLDRATVAERLKELISDPRSLNQATLNLCGPAALFMEWINRDPEAFATFAATLFDTGEASLGSLDIKPDQELVNADYSTLTSKGSGDPPAQADWMILGALRNAHQVFWQPSWAGNPKQELAALTRPEELTDWFNATGIFTTVSNEANWATAAGIPHATSITLGEGTSAVLLIHMNLIAQAKIDGKPAAENVGQDNTFLMNQFPNHYVHLLSEVTPSIDNKTVRLSIWSWGHAFLNMDVPRDAFVSNYYGAVKTYIA
jgi:hypothetical protein